ncbi:MAG: hypothetical protein J3R72DRAFT_180306 [Linnemannia gamsii]|nr:MAG: hypothetical protein J3R72DRAFT_180306 [Linnemannia gamsii]
MDPLSRSMALCFYLSLAHSAVFLCLVVVDHASLSFCFLRFYQTNKDALHRIQSFMSPLPLCKLCSTTKAERRKGRGAMDSLFTQKKGCSGPSLFFPPSKITNHLLTVLYLLKKLFYLLRFLWKRDVSKSNGRLYNKIKWPRTLNTAGNAGNLFRYKYRLFPYLSSLFIPALSS